MTRDCWMICADNAQRVRCYALEVTVSPLISSFSFCVQTPSTLFGPSRRVSSVLTVSSMSLSFSCFVAVSSCSSCLVHFFMHDWVLLTQYSQFHPCGERTMPVTVWNVYGIAVSMMSFGPRWANLLPNSELVRTDWGENATYASCAMVLKSVGLDGVIFGTSLDISSDTVICAMFIRFPLIPSPYSQRHL